MNESALDQALNTVKGAFGGVGNFLGQIGNNAGQELGRDFNTASQGVQQFGQQAAQFLNPASYDLNNPQSPLSTTLTNIAPHAENLFSGLSLGYYQPPAEDQTNMSQFTQALEKGVGGAVPFIAGSIATGGALDVALAPEALAALGGRELLATAGGGALTGLASPANSWAQRGANTLGGGITGLGFGALGGISNPVIQAGLGSLSMAGLTALQGGNRDQILANAVLGIGTPLFFKGMEVFGGGEVAQNKMTDLYQEFGSDSYRFLANKDLIQRVVTGNGSPEDIYQFNVLNSLGKAAEAARAPEGISVEDATTRVPKTGPVWDFLNKVFPQDFKNGIPSAGFTDPTTSPLNSIQPMSLDENENDALMKINENNPNPENSQPLTTREALQNKIASLAQEVQGGQLAEQGGRVLNSVKGENSLETQAKPTTEITPTNSTQPETPAETILSAIMSGDMAAASDLHQTFAAEDPTLPSLDELKAEAVMREGDQSQQLAEAKSEESQNNIMKTPEIAQHKAIIRKAVRTYNLVKARGNDDLATITLKVPGLDSALQNMREQGVDVQNMDHLIQLAKELPKKSGPVKVKPETTSKVSMQPAAPVTIDQAAPGYDFEKDMESQAGSRFDTGSAMQQQQSLEAGAGKSEAPTGGSISLPGENVPQFTQQPAGGYVKDLSSVITRVAQGELDNYPVGRDFTKIMVGRRSTNENIAKITKDWVDRVLPDPKAREQAFLAADNSIPSDKLTPNQQLVVEQLNGLNELIGLRKMEMYPGFQTTDNYFQRVPVPGSNEPEPASGRALGQSTRSDFHRAIWKFVPEGGDATAKPFIQSTDSENFKLQQVPEDRTLWTDPATGQNYRMDHATVNEIEKALPVRYVKDIGDVMAQNVNDFLNQKDHHFAVEAIQNGVWKNDIAAPGTTGPAKGRLIDVKGLEGWKASPQAATALENLAHDPSISQWEKGYSKGEDYVTQLVFYNALKHPFNMMNLALGYSGQFRTGNSVVDAILPGPVGMAKLISNLPKANDLVMQRGDEYWAMKDAGSNIGTFGKNATEGFIKKYEQKTPVKSGLEVVGKYNPGALFYKGNRAIVAHIDDILRTGLTLTYQDSGLPLNEAVSQADKNMVDYGNLSRGEKRASRLAFMFYPWLKGLLGGAAKMAQNPVEYRGSIQNFVLMGLAGMGATMAWQQFTGNKNASVDQYGLNNLANQVTKAPGEAASGRIPTVISSHFLRPILKEAIQQGTNYDLFTGRSIYDKNKIIPESQLNQSQQSEKSVRTEHAAKGLIAPVQPFMKILHGSQTNTEAAANFLGFKTPHTAEHAAAPALMKTTNPLASLNLPGTANNPTQPTTGIDALNFKDSLSKSLDANTRQQLSTVSQLNSKAYAEGNPMFKMQAYGLLVTNPALQEAQSKMEVGTAQAEGRPVNPLWALGLTSPDLQKTVLQYKALLPGDQKTFMTNPQNAAVVGAFKAMSADYYSQLPQDPTVQAAQKAGFQPPVESQDVKDLLTQAKATKNYSLYDDPRVTAYFNQWDFYDNYLNSQFGLQGSTTSGGGGGKSNYVPFNSPQGQALNEERYMLKQMMYQGLSNSTQGQQVKLGVPKPATATGLGSLRQLKVAAPISGPPPISIRDLPNIGRVNFKPPVFSGIKLGGGSRPTIQ